MINLTLLNVRNHEEWRPEPRSKLEDIWIYENGDNQVVHIRANLNPTDKGQLVHLMKQYKEIFA